MLAVVVFVIAVLNGVFAEEDCAPLHIGCFKPNADNKILFSDKSEHEGEDFFSGKLVNWGEFESYLYEAACRCERKAAEEGYKFFSLREFGQCHGIGKGKKTIAELKMEKSEICIAHNYEQCADGHTRCTGADDDGEFVFEVKIELGPKVVDGGYTAWSKWSKCSKSCGGGVMERDRSCSNPVPSGTGAKDCGVLGKPTELKLCSTKKCVEKVDVPAKDSYHTKVICEHRGVREIKCPHPNHVITIRGANYGRLNTDFCQFGKFRRTNCRAQKSNLQIKTQCNGHNSCKINPSNSVYGDPCVGIVKYVSVDYKCSYKSKTEHTAVFCEHRGAKTITCAAGSRIKIIGANYGRLSTDYCKFNNYRRTNCRAKTSQDKIKALCDGKTSCSVNPHNSVFGDPCVGIVKYVSAKYMCYK